MRFRETELVGAYIIELDLLSDERGFFARTFCREEFSKHGLNPVVEQCNLSFNIKKGTIRGMHYQVEPGAEAKLVRCSRGAVYDVIVDLRRGSNTYLKWTSVDLTQDNHRMLYIPEGFAHGFQTLTENAEVLYQMSDSYAPDLARGIRWDDPAIGIKWPIETRTISEKDLSYENYRP